jgi:hypothetical protein
LQHRWGRSALKRKPERRNDYFAAPQCHATNVTL